MESPLYPSVTEIIGKIQDLSFVPPERLEAGARRGSAVHQYCACKAQGLWAAKPSEYEGFCDSFDKWYASFVLETVLVEQELIDPVFGFRGHIDLYVRTSEGLLLVDLKTPVATSKFWRLQLAAYFKLLHAQNCKIDRAGALRLSAQGELPKLDYCKYTHQDFNIFLSALNVYRFLNG